MTRSWCSLALLLVALVIPATASAGGWLPPAPANDTRDTVSRSALTFEQSGALTALWANSDDTSAQFNLTTRQPGGAWPRSTALFDPTSAIREVRLATAPSGELVALWVGINALNQWQVFSASRPAGSTEWTPPVMLSNGAGFSDAPVLSIGPDGTVIALWSQTPAGDVRVRASVRPAGSGIWQSPVWVSDAGEDAQLVRVARMPTGDAVVMWVTEFVAQGVMRQHVRRAEYAVQSAAWSPPAVASDESRTSFAPEVDADAQGNVVATWQRYDGANNRTQATIRRAGSSSWSPPLDISPPGTMVWTPKIALFGGGRTVATWLAGDVVWVAERPAFDAPWGPPRDLGPGREPFLVVAGDAEPVIAWLRVNDGVEAAVMSARRLPDGSWSTPETLEVRPYSSLVPLSAPQLTRSATGDVAAWWTREGSSSRRLLASVFDATPPSLALAPVPATARAGEPVSMSASATDQWSTVGPITWDFGDGATAEGASVTHAYAAPGTYAVRATATDAAGNAVSRTSTITVSAAAQTPSPAPVAVAPVLLGKLSCTTKRQQAPRSVRITCTGERVPSAATTVELRVLAKTKRKRGKRSTLAKATGTTTTRTVTFSLRPNTRLSGRYPITLTLTPAGGARTTQSLTLRF